jgi:predicted phosphodiesterase
MRYGIIADVHGNLHALESAVEALRRRRVDRFLCAGDIVGYGAYPNECIALIRSLDAVCVAGNHDLIAVGRLADDRAGTLAQLTLRWTRGALTDDSRAFLAALPLRVDVERKMVMAHGSLEDPQEYIRSRRLASRELRQLARMRAAAQLLVIGHTHVAAAWRAPGRVCRPEPDGTLRLHRGDRYLLNPGAVGQSRQREILARCMVLDPDAGLATFDALPYDVTAAREGLERAGLPATVYHVPRKRVRTAVRRARRAPARLRRALTWDRSPHSPR